jgi:hypothetical protein
MLEVTGIGKYCTGSVAIFGSYLAVAEVAVVPVVGISDDARLLLLEVTLAAILLVVVEMAGYDMPTRMSPAG